MELIDPSRDAFVILTSKQGHDFWSFNMDTTCTKCGSDKMMPNIEVLDRAHSGTMRLSVVVYGNPDAVIFKERGWAEIRANICGECGHTELSVANPQALYRHYERGRLRQDKDRKGQTRSENNKRSTTDKLFGKML